MSEWDASAISARYSGRADNADRRLRDLDLNLKTNPRYGVEYDAVLADFWVYNYLRGKTFLSSRAELLGALREMLRLEDQVKSGARPIDKERFIQSWRRKIENMIDALETGKPVS